MQTNSFYHNETKNSSTLKQRTVMVQQTTNPAKQGARSFTGFAWDHRPTPPVYL